MKISRNSKLIRAIYGHYWPFSVIGFTDSIPTQTSICVLFWATLILIPLRWAALILVIAASPILLIVWGGMKLSRKMKGGRIDNSLDIVGEFIRAKKSKICPIVEIIE